MAGQEERFWRTEKRRQKQRVARQNRARVRRSLEQVDYEGAQEDPQVPIQQRVAQLHIGRNKPKPEPKHSPLDTPSSPLESSAD